MNNQVNAHLPVGQKMKDVLKKNNNGKNNGNGQQTTTVTKKPRELPEVMTTEGSEFIKRYIVPRAQARDLKDIQVQLLAKEYTFKDIIGKRCHVLPYYDIDSQSTKYAIVESIHQLMAKADSTGELDGVEDESDGSPDSLPTWAITTVWRAGKSHPFKAKIFFKEFARFKRDGNLMANWKEKPDFMLRKCSRAAALRLAFPEALMNAYIIEEFGTEPIVDMSEELTEVYDIQEENNQDKKQNSDKPEQRQKTDEPPDVEEAPQKENSDKALKSFIKNMKKWRKQFIDKDGDDEAYLDVLDGFGYDDMDCVPKEDYTKVLEALNKKFSE